MSLTAPAYIRRSALPTLAFLLFTVSSQAQTLSPLALRGYTVIPEPQTVELSESDIRFGPDCWIEAEDGADSAVVEVLREELTGRFGLSPGQRNGTVVRLSMKAGSVAPGKATDNDTAAIAAQAYRIDIAENLVSIAANAPEGLFYGVETLAQLLRTKDASLWLPKGRITDWPDLHRRHIYWDNAHHLDRLPELKRAVRQAAFFKINGFAIKLEGHFQYKSAPALVEPYALTPAEYQELTDYGLRYHVQVIPFLDAPSHLAFALKHPEYAKYRSFPDSNYQLCATNPEAVKFISGMFQELIDANRGGKYVYLSTDEPYYIGMAANSQCNEKTAAGQKGSVGKLLADFIGQVANPLHQQGRTVIFWGEYPLKVSDLASLPPHLVNGEVYGPEFDATYRKLGMRQMIYTSTQGGETRFFPDYFTLPNSRRLHPVPSQVDRLRDGFRSISYNSARGTADLMGAVVAAWGDVGLHPETFWLGYTTITAAGWHPGSPAVEESASSFYRLFYGDAAIRMDRVYQLMSQQAHYWLDSWEWGPSSRKPIFGNSDKIFNPRQPLRDQTLALPAALKPQVPFDSGWMKENARRLQLAADSLVENDELIGLLHENLRRVGHNRYNLEVYLAVAQLYRQNLAMLLDVGRMCSMLDRSARAAAGKNSEEALESMDRALDLARQIRQSRNTAYRDAVATYQKSWFPRVAEANGRKYFHDLDDVKDHVPDRTVDMTYLIERELQLPFGAWVESVRAERNRLAQVYKRPLDKRAFDWLDMSDQPVVGGIPE